MSAENRNNKTTKRNRERTGVETRIRCPFSESLRKVKENLLKGQTNKERNQRSANQQMEKKGMFHVEQYDVIVVGAGHAGCEAAHISAKMGCTTLLITMNTDTMGQMSCNPAIGGLAKGHLVKEIDVLGGIMGFLTDQTGIQFRMLNKSKGAAVWSPRAQVDRIFYRTAMRQFLEKVENLFIKKGMVKEILVNNKNVHGVKLVTGEEIKSRAVVLCNGTFLNGLIHIGLQSHPAGRTGEPPSEFLTENLKTHGFQAGRLKTGTPPRINGDTIDFSKTIEQKGDDDFVPFSFRTPEISKPQKSCFLTHTNSVTHKIIRNSLGESPLYTGKIKGIGPRYCPSIEDKIVRFSTKENHQIFLEPEGESTSDYYVNGFSTSIPEKAQKDALQSISGLEKVEIVKYGYAIEYDYFPPTQLIGTLETKPLQNLYFAGQINGTSGYEEAAAQGLVAGINAVLKIKGEEPFILSRSDAYIGVLIDDLILKGTEEPYRLFTSRAEYRLLLRQDNADARLFKYAGKLGLLPEKDYVRMEEKQERIKKILEWLRTYSIEPQKANPVLLEKGTSALSQKGKAIDLLKRPCITLQDIKSMGGEYFPKIAHSRSEEFTVEVEVKYEGYIIRQQMEIEKLKKLESAKIPALFNYDSINGLLTESRQKLKKIQPQTVGQATRISGVTPADISILVAHLR